MNSFGYGFLSFISKLIWNHNLINYYIIIDEEICHLDTTSIKYRAWVFWRNNSNKIRMRKWWERFIIICNNTWSCTDGLVLIIKNDLCCIGDTRLSVEILYKKIYLSRARSLCSKRSFFLDINTVITDNIIIIMNKIAICPIQNNCVDRYEHFFFVVIVLFLNFESAQEVTNTKMLISREVDV